MREDLEVVIADTLLEKGVTVRFNEFTHSMMVATPGAEEHVLQDDDWHDIKLKLHNAGVRPPAGLLESAVRVIGRAHAYHPVRDYLATLAWDGTPRIGDWLVKYAQADDNEYVKAVGRLVLTAAVRRVRQPGCKFDELLTLVGAEGIGKSTAVSALSPDPGWFSDSLPLGEGPQKTIEQTTGIWLCESAELVSPGAKGTADIKAFLSRQVDGPVRMAWGREPVRRPRQFVPIATTNERAFLKSMNGDRRFWPVVVRYVDTSALTRDRDQLWAEACVVEARGESIRLDVKLWDVAQQAQEEFRAEDPFEAQLRYTTVGMKISLPGIFDLLGIRTVERTIGMSQRIAAVMQKNGYRKKRAMVNGERTTQYEYITPFDPEGFHHRPEPEPDVPEGAMSTADLENMLADAEEGDYVAMDK